MRLPYLHATPCEVRRPGVARTWLSPGLPYAVLPCLAALLPLPWPVLRSRPMGPRLPIQTCGVHIVVGPALCCPAVRGQARGGATASSLGRVHIVVALVGLSHCSRQAGHAGAAGAQASHSLWERRAAGGKLAPGKQGQAGGGARRAGQAGTSRTWVPGSVGSPGVRRVGVPWEAVVAWGPAASLWSFAAPVCACLSVPVCVPAHVGAAHVGAVSAPVGAVSCVMSVYCVLCFLSASWLEAAVVCVCVRVPVCACMCTHAWYGSSSCPPCVS